METILYNSSFKDENLFLKKLEDICICIIDFETNVKVAATPELIEVAQHNLLDEMLKNKPFSILKKSKESDFQGEVKEKLYAIEYLIGLFGISEESLTSHSANNDLIYLETLLKMWRSDTGPISSVRTTLETSLKKKVYLIGENIPGFLNVKVESVIYCFLKIYKDFYEIKIFKLTGFRQRGARARIDTFYDKRIIGEKSGGFLNTVVQIS
ncbi:hypothetical protein ACTFIW_012084 [Dictyostelium discoideum]